LTESPDAQAFLKEHAAKIQSLAKVSGFEKITKEQGARTLERQVPQAVKIIAQPALELRISLEGLVNFEEEVKRLSKEVEKVSADLAFVQNKLSQETFIARAPAALVAKERSREN
jgi:valyl-tRNA synthetase